MMAYELMDFSLKLGVSGLSLRGLFVNVVLVDSLNNLAVAFAAAGRFKSLERLSLRFFNDNGTQRFLRVWPEAKTSDLQHLAELTRMQCSNTFPCLRSRCR